MIIFSRKSHGFWVPPIDGHTHMRICINSWATNGITMVHNSAWGYRIISYGELFQAMKGYPKTSRLFFSLLKMTIAIVDYKL